MERWHQTIKRECIRPQTPLSLTDARRVVAAFVRTYNTERLHSGIAYVTPQARLEGLDTEIIAERRRKLAAAQLARQLAYRQLQTESQVPIPAVA